MGNFKVKGIVLKELNIGESNKQIIILTKEHGKMLLSAKGARTPKSKFLAGTQLFAYSDFIVFEGKGFFSISQAEIIESFYNLRKDIDRFAYAAYYLELVERTILEDMQCDEIMELLLRTLAVVSKTQYNIKLATRVFELKYLQLSGFMPELESCSICGGEIIDRETYFNSAIGGVVCDNCHNVYADTIKISKGSFMALKFVITSEPKKVFNFDVSSAVLYEMSHIVKQYMYIHINERFKTLEFAEELEYN